MNIIRSHCFLSLVCIYFLKCIFGVLDLICDFIKEIFLWVPICAHMCCTNAYKCIINEYKYLCYKWIKVEYLSHLLQGELYFFFLNPHPKICLLILERGRKREKERNIDWLPLVHAPTGDQTCNLGMFLYQELNPQPLGLLEDTQPTEPHWPRQAYFLFHDRFYHNIEVILGEACVGI